MTFVTDRDRINFFEATEGVHKDKVVTHFYSQNQTGVVLFDLDGLKKLRSFISTQIRKIENK